MTSRRLLGLVAVAMLAGCDGAVTLGASAPDAGMPGRDSGKDATSGKDAGSTTGPVDVDAGEYRGDGSFFVDAGAHDGDASLLVDASEYRGDGSFFLDATGAGDALSGGSDGSSGTGGDASAGTDATPGCAPLAACCGSLTGTSRSLCASVAASGNAANCSAELSELEGNGDCTGVSVLASQIQVVPTWLASDGTTLFYVTSESPGLLAVPVGGGAVATLLSGKVNPDFLVVDDVNVYVMEPHSNGSPFSAWSLLRIPKNGSAASLVNDVGAYVLEATTLGGTVYWIQSDSGPEADNATVSIHSEGLPAGSSSLLGGRLIWGNTPSYVGATNKDVFLGGEGALEDFPMTGLPDSGFTTVHGGASCGYLTSDSDAVYCAEQNGQNLRFASDRTVSNLGAAVSSSYIVVDDTYAYWANEVMAGTIVKAPKAGGGTATVIARDTSPTAIAVDAHSVYWADAAGSIKSVPK
jgi:hypothetical protein